MAQRATKDRTDQPNQQPAGPPESRSGQLALGLLFGIIFGLLLQKGGVGKYEVLIGVLLLEDFTVVKVMLSAIVVGMLGIYWMHGRGMVKLHVKPTRYAANILGGVVFGIGFALAAYCPGTTATALGQGNYDAIAVVVGMMAGSYVFAEASAWLSRTVEPWGNRGELTLPGLLKVRSSMFVPIFAGILVLVLAALHVFIDPTP